MAASDSSAASDDEYDYVSAIVIDNGSGLIKAGFEDQDEPVCVFPSVVGHLREAPAQHQMGNFRTRRVGNDAISRKSTLCLRYPIERGIVKSWDDMSYIWSHTFHNELKVAPENHAVLLTASPEIPSRDKEEMTKIMFETFGVPAMQLGNETLQSLWSTGRTEVGMVVDCGYSVTRAVPIYEGRALSHAVGRLDLGGRDLTDYMAQLLMKRGYKFPSSAETDILRGIKEKLSSVAQDFEQALLAVDASNAIETILAERWSKEMEIVRDWCTDCLDTQTVRHIKETLAFAADETNPDVHVDMYDEEKYEMPDGSVITIGSERFRCIEPLFKPSLLGRQGPGLSQMISDSIQKCDPTKNPDLQIRKELVGNVVLTGGTTVVRNLNARVQKELTSLCVFGLSRVCSAGKHGAWIGGSMCCGLSGMQDRWISKDEYRECGKSIIHRKKF